MLETTGAMATRPAAYAKTSLAIANLRGLFLLILLSFHASLAYLGSTPPPRLSFDQPPFQWLAYPIVDSRRFYGFDIYCAWVDAHAMAMMFFVSGLFVPPSLKRKGPARFAADRLLRLGLPFLFGLFVVMPAGLYPVFCLSRPEAGLAEYLAAYRTLPFLPNGPVWFLWLLLAFSLLVAPAPRALGALARLAANPRRFLVVFAASAAAAYLPLALIFGPFDWYERGPFNFQLSRPLLYAVFFLGGAAVSAGGLGEGLLAPDGVLSRNWRRLAALSPLALLVWMGLTGATLAYPAFAPLPLRALSALAYVGASLTGVMLVLGLAIRFSARPIRWLAPLSQNALGIFALHYAPLVWTQYLLLDAPLPAIVKAPIVFVATVLASLGLAAGLARLGWLARFVGEEPRRRILS
jgi:hypothetical protein